MSDKFGVKVAKNVYQLSKTFSLRQKDKYLMEIKELNINAFDYLSAIPATSWLSSEWLINENMPPRYGICTSNMSESMNNMLQGARDVCWLESINFIITKMATRICKLREQYKKHIPVVVDYALAKIKEQWENCSGFTVNQIEEDGCEYFITRTNTLLSQLPTTHTINVETKTCTCGLWQEYGIPCIDATAFMKLYEQRNLEYVLLHNVSKFYKVSNMKELFKTNIRILLWHY